MVPKFEKRVRAYAVELSALAIVVIVASLGISNPYIKWILIISTYFLVAIFPLFISKGQTFGKRTQQIKVVNLDGSEASNFKLILREVFKMLLSLITFGIYSIIAFFLLTEKEVSRTIHDYIFKTKVIELNSKPQIKTDDFLGKTESMKKRGF